MNTSLTIRSADADDLDAILSLFDTARRFMAANGNPSQWNEGYPNADIVRADIAHGNCYVCTPTDRQTLVGTFAFILGKEPTYRLIEQGHWHADRPYGTIHRMASDGHTHGIAHATFDYCAAQTDYLRIDTHTDNRPMLRAITRYGFRPCGIIYVRDGSPRLAFDLERPSAGRP